MPVEMTYNLYGDEELRRKLALAAKKSVDLTPALKKASMVMYRSIVQNFRAQGRPTRWKPLKPATIRARRKGKGAGSARILQDTGRLRQSVTSAHGPNSVYKLSPTQLVIGTNLKYAKIHQEGGHTGPRTIVPKRKKALHWISPSGEDVFAKRVEHPGAKIPARPYLLFQEEDKARISQITLQHIMEAFR